jgi:hypothetical protein
MSTNPQTTPTETNPAAKTLDQVRADVYADGKVFADELRLIREKIEEDGKTTKEELKLFESDFKRALLDATSAEEKAKITATAEGLLGTQKMIKSFMYFVAAVLGIGVLSWLVTNGQLMSLVLQLLG